MRAFRGRCFEHAQGSVNNLRTTRISLANDKEINFVKTQFTPCMTGGSLLEPETEKAEMRRLAIGVAFSHLFNLRTIWTMQKGYNVQSFANSLNQYVGVDSVQHPICMVEMTRTGIANLDPLEASTSFAPWFCEEKPRGNTTTTPHQNSIRATK
jgi:hypothetical protein